MLRFFLSLFLLMMLAVNCNQQSDVNKMISVSRNGGPVITNQSDHHVFVDYLSSMSIFVDAEGDGQLTYQWQVETENGFVDIPGATSNTFSKDVVNRDDNNKVYICQVSDQTGTTQSNYIIVIVDKIPPIIVTQPENVTVNIGETIYLYAEGSGTESLNPVWKKNDVAIEGATSSLLQIDNAQLSDSGHYTCEISNDYGSVITNTVYVTVAGAVQVILLNDLSGSTATAEIGINGIYTNCLFNQPGKFNPCVKFKNTISHVEIPYNNGMVISNNGDKPFSIGIWFKLDAVPQNATTIFRRGTIVAKNYEFGLTIEGGGYLIMRLGNSNCSQYIQASTANIVDTEWHHIIATYDGSYSADGIKIYFDDVRSDVSKYSSGSYSGVTAKSSATRIGWTPNMSVEKFFFANKELKPEDLDWSNY